MSNTFSGYRPVSLREAPAAQSTSPSSVLQETLIETPFAEALPVASSRPMMEVVAPATLPEGYEFQVELGRTKYNVKVPPGGVEKGQTFSVPLTEAAAAAVSSSHAEGSIPVGHWRDELCHCFNYGICHPHCWTSWLCTFLAAAQVIRRMQFDWTGKPTDDPNKRAMAFPIIAVIVVVYFTLHFGIYFVLVSLDPNFGHDEDKSWVKVDPSASYNAVLLIYQCFGIAYWIISTIVLIQTRRSVRERYGIPASEMEDCCLGVFCHCCVAGQLLRHTTDYDVYPSTIFTDTGLPSTVSAIV